MGLDQRRRCGCQPLPETNILILVRIEHLEVPQRLVSDVLNVVPVRRGDVRDIAGLKVERARGAGAGEERYTRSA